MNTKNKIIAILMAGIVAMAIAVPMAMGEGADTSASVNNLDPTVVSVSSTPETLVTLLACPTTTLLTIDATVSDLNGVGDIASVTVEIPGIQGTPIAMSCSGTGTTKTCTKSFDLACDLAPQLYTATVNVTDGAGQFAIDTDTFTVQERTGISLNFDTVSFGPADPGTDNVDGVNKSSGTPVVATVTNDGNKAKDITVLAGVLSGTGANTDTIAGSKMEADLTDDPDVGWKSVGSSYTFLNTNLGCGDSSQTAFRLDIPNVKTDTYTGALTISAVDA